MRRAIIVLGLLALVRTGHAQPNDDCVDATVVGALPYTDTVDTTTATTEGSDPTLVGVPTFEECEFFPFLGGRSVWYQYTSPAGGSLEVDTFGSDYDTVLFAWRGTCGSFGVLGACNNDDFDVSATAGESRMIVTLAAGETILIEVTTSNYDPGGGNLVFHVEESPVFQVHDPVAYYPTGEDPDVAAGSDGTFLVVWDRSYTIMGRRFCATGAPLGAPFPVSDTEGSAERPKVTRAGDGFVVAWIEGDVRGRRVTGSGVPTGPVFDVGSGQPAYYDFDLAADATGKFIVTWADYDSDGDESGILARRFDVSGTPLGSAFAVNSYTTDLQVDPNVAAGAGGEFVIVWQSGEYDFLVGQDGDRFGIFGQRFDAAGSPAGGEFQANVTTTGHQWYPSVAADPSGAFVAVWQDLSDDCGGGGGYGCVMARRYDTGGSAQGSEFVVSPFGTGPPPFYVYIDTDRNAGGDFVVAWADEGTYPRARAFATDGTPQGGAIQVSHVEVDYQRRVRVALSDAGDFVVAWDWSPTGGSYRIMGRAEGPTTTCPAVTGCPAAPRTGCKQPTTPGKGNLTLKNQTPDTRDALIWKWVKGEATTVAEIGDALTADSYTLCLYDGDDVLLSEATVPPGGTCAANPCWKDLAGLGFKYADKPGDNGDVRKLVLKSGDAGQAKVIVKVQGAGLGVPPLPPTLPLRAQLASTTGTCWEAEFRADGVTTSTPTVFGGRPHVGSPSGAFIDR